MNDAPIRTIPYREFSDGIHGKVVAERIPADGTIELTYRCNLKCAHCYCVHDPACEEMTYREVCSVLDQVADAGCLWLLFTGGEPLLRPDFPDIYMYALKKGIIATLFTNGTLITPQIADLLKEYKPFKTEITIYGATAQTYEKVTGVPGSFERCMSGIRLFVERGIPLRLKTVAMTLNKHELPKMKQLAAGLGLSRFKFDPMINPRLDGSKGPCALRLSPEEIVELDLKDEDRMADWRAFCDKWWHSVYDEDLFNCGAGINYFHVNPFGRLRMCDMIAEPAFDLRKGSFREGWDRLVPEVRARKRTRDVKCRDCDAGPVCEHCPGSAALENNDPEEPVEFLCRVARLRTEAFGMSGKL